MTTSSAWNHGLHCTKKTKRKRLRGLEWVQKHKYTFEVTHRQSNVVGMSTVWAMWGLQSLPWGFFVPACWDNHSSLPLPSLSRWDLIPCCWIWVGFLLLLRNRMQHKWCYLSTEAVEICSLWLGLLNCWFWESNCHFLRKLSCWFWESNCHFLRKPK